MAWVRLVCRSDEEGLLIFVFPVDRDVRSLRSSVAAAAEERGGLDSALHLALGQEGGRRIVLDGCNFLSIRACSIVDCISLDRIPHVARSFGKQNRARLFTFVSSVETQRNGMKVTVNSFHAIAMWRWRLKQSGHAQEDEDEDDNLCGICRIPYDGCCPDCTHPGDDCPLSQCSRSLVSAHFPPTSPNSSIVHFR